MAKIALIGAGSVVFARKLVCDIIQRPALAGSTLALMDIDPDRLKVAEIQMRKIVAQLGVPVKVEAYSNRRKALRGAKYAINIVQVGGFDATKQDFNIPKKYGVLQTIADTLGIGGIFRSLRTIPVVLALARDLDEVGAPEPILINYTNPQAPLVLAVSRAVGIPAVGLCHSVQLTARQLARYLRLPFEECAYRVAGINHQAFFMDFRYRGRDMYPALFKALDDPEIYAMDRVRFEMMRRLGYFVTESSEHQAEYSPYFIHHGKEIIERFGIPIDDYIRRCERIIVRWEKTRREMLQEDKPAQISPLSPEYGAMIINARETGELAEINGNVPNTGLIPNLPAGCAVEVPVVIDRLGLHPEQVGDLPPQLAAYIRTNVNVQELIVEAALTRKREHVYHAAMLDPHLAASLPLDGIWKLCDELLEAQAKYLPEYEPTAPNTGRTARGLTDVPSTRLEPTEVPFSRKEREARFAVIVDNPGKKPLSLPLKVRVEGAGYRVEKLPARVRVPAGKEKSFSFVLKRSTRAADVFRLDVEVPAFCLPGFYRRQMPRRLEIPLLKRPPVGAGAFGVGAEIKMTAAGLTAVKGRLVATSRELCFRLEVDDTNVKRVGGAPWEGSCLEVYAASPERRTSTAAAPRRPCKLFVVPCPEKKAVEVFARTKAKNGKRALVAVGGTRGRSTVVPGGYELELRLPWKALGVEAGKPFLFELRAFLNALGTDHGRTETAWAGAPSPTNSSDGMFLSVPKAK